MNNPFKKIFAPRSSLKEQASFAKRLAFLMGAEIPLVSCLEMLRSQTRPAAQKKRLGMAIELLSGGMTLHDSLARVPGILDESALQVIRMGEATGTLGQSLGHLSVAIQKRGVLRQKMASACAYPACVVVATFGIIGFLGFSILPKILPVFESVRGQLPLATRILIGSMRIFQGWGIEIFSGAGAVMAFGALLRSRSERFKLLLQKVMLRLPLIGSLAQKACLENFCRTLGLMLRSGAPLLDALHIAAEALPHLEYRHALRGIDEDILRGERISTCLARHPRLFPDLAVQMILAGEMGGSLADALSYLSQMYEAEIDDLTKNMSSLLEPALMIFVGLLVGFVSLSILSPIYEITQNLSH